MIRVRNVVRPPRPMRCAPYLLPPGVWVGVDEQFLGRFRLAVGLEWDMPVPEPPEQRRSMRVIVPYANRNGRILRDQVMERLAGEAEFINVGRSERAYSALFASLWALRKDFCIIEQDVVVDKADLDAFEACPEPWCHAGDMSLGCVRFRRKIMRNISDIFSRWPDHPGWVHGHWQHLDDAVHTRLSEAGFVAHSHRQVVHLARER